MAALIEYVCNGKARSSGGTIGHAGAGFVGVLLVWSDLCAPMDAHRPRRDRSTALTRLAPDAHVWRRGESADPSTARRT